MKQRTNFFLKEIFFFKDPEDVISRSALSSASLTVFRFCFVFSSHLMPMGLIPPCLWSLSLRIFPVDVGQSLRRSGMGVLHVGVDVGAVDAEVDVIYISFIVSVQYIGYLIPYRDKVKEDN